MGRIARFFLGAVLISSLSCAKDKNLEDFKHEQALKDAARYNAVEGRYTGLMTSLRDHRVLGALQLRLRTRFSVTPNNDGTGATGTPILVLELSFEDSHVMSITAQDGSYDPDTGIYQADITATPQSPQSQSQPGQTGTPGSSNSAANQSGKAEKISLTAHIEGGTITGSLEALDYEDDGSTFVVTRSEKTLHQVAQEANVTAATSGQDMLQVKSFLGQSKFKTGEIKPVRIVILHPRRGGDQDFIDLLSPVKSVQVSFNYDSSAHILSQNGLWDLRSGTLTGETVIIRQTQTASPTTTAWSVPSTLSFECRTPMTDRVPSSISCTHITNERGVVVAETTGMVEATPGPDPSDVSVTARAQSLTFNGKAMIDKTDPSGGRDIELKVSYPARTRMDDILDLFMPDAQKTLQVTFILSQNVSVGFNRVLWDSGTGTLDATNDPSLTAPTPGIPLWLPEIHCTDFYFTNQRRPFVCRYQSNRSPEIVLTMKP